MSVHICILSNMVLQVVIPMAGLGIRFKQYGFTKNKYLLPVADTPLGGGLTFLTASPLLTAKVTVSPDQFGQRDTVTVSVLPAGRSPATTNCEGDSVTGAVLPMIEMAVASLCINVPCTYFFIINEEAGRDYELRDILHKLSAKYRWDSVITSVPVLTEGPASTVYHIRDLLDMSAPMIVANSDQIMYWNFSDFWNKCMEPGVDGCVVTYTPDYELVVGATDKHSFVRMDPAEKGVVVECAEKMVLSSYALVGIHYFRTGTLFVDAYQNMVDMNLRAPNGEFYLSLVYETLLRRPCKNGQRDEVLQQLTSKVTESPEKFGSIDIYHIDSINEVYYPVGEPADYFRYMNHMPNCKQMLVDLDFLTC